MEAQTREKHDARSRWSFFRRAVPPAPGGTPSAIVERNRQLERQNRQLRLSVMRLSRLVRTDGLTGLANRRHLDEVLDAEIRRACRAAAPVALLLCDVDLFKRYNDTFGHVAGDAVLVELGDVLSGYCRRAGDVAARYGGEEFALLLPGTGPADAIAVGERLRRRVADLSIRVGEPVRLSCVTVSVGVAALHSVTPCPPADLIRAADAALYRAKKAGRNRTEFETVRRSRERCR
jgi:diguanylate cyclase (GGDEF)-like protein